MRMFFWCSNCIAVDKKWPTVGSITISFLGENGANTLGSNYSEGLLVHTVGFLRSDAPPKNNYPSVADEGCEWVEFNDRISKFTHHKPQPIIAKQNNKMTTEMQAKELGEVNMFISKLFECKILTCLYSSLLGSLLIPAHQYVRLRLRT